MSVGTSTGRTIKKWIRRDLYSPYTVYTDDDDEVEDEFGNITTEGRQLVAHTQAIDLNTLIKQGFNAGNLEEKTDFRQGWTFDKDLRRGDRLEFKGDNYEIMGIVDHEFHVYFTGFLVT